MWAYWCPETATRGLDRPRRRWQNELDVFLESWKEVARNSDRWKGWRHLLSYGTMQAIIISFTLLSLSIVSLIALDTKHCKEVWRCYVAVAVEKSERLSVWEALKGRDIGVVIVSKLWRTPLPDTGQMTIVWWIPNPKEREVWQSKELYGRVCRALHEPGKNFLAPFWQRLTQYFIAFHMYS